MAIKTFKATLKANWAVFGFNLFNLNYDDRQKLALSFTKANKATLLNWQDNPTDDSKIIVTFSKDV